MDHGMRIAIIFGINDGQRNRHWLAVAADECHVRRATDCRRNCVIYQHWETATREDDAAVVDELAADIGWSIDNRAGRRIADDLRWLAIIRAKNNVIDR